MVYHMKAGLRVGHQKRNNPDVGIDLEGLERIHRKLHHR